METNEITGQTQPGQNTQAEQLRPLTLTVPATSEPEQPQPAPVPTEPEPTAETTEPVPNDTPPMPEPPAPETPRLYDQAKADRIAECLRELLDPAYILLFGTLAGGTPHSDTHAYDLLVIVDGQPPYNWRHVKRYLKTKIPSVGHGLPHMNLYVYTLHDMEAYSTPFFYLARREGIVLYRSCHRKFRRPRRKFDFGAAADTARRYSGIFLPLAGQLLLHAEKMTDRTSIRLSAFCMAQAAVCCLRTLFYVYHGFEADTFDVEMLYSRLRTLSGELPLLLEPGTHDSLLTLACLKRFIVRARYDSDFFICPEELSQHFERVKQLRNVVEKSCSQRIDLYIELARQDEPDEP